LDTSGFGCSSSRSRVKGCWQAADRQPNVQQTAELEAKNLEPKNKHTQVPAHFDFNQDLCSTSAEKVVIFFSSMQTAEVADVFKPRLRNTLRSSNYTTSFFFKVHFSYIRNETWEQ